MTSIATDILLIQTKTTLALAQHIANDKLVLQHLATTWELGELRSRAVWSEAEQELYLYLDLAAPSQIQAASVKAMEKSLQSSFLQAGEIRVSRLSRVFDRAGASFGAPFACHYVVETDPEVGWMEEIGRWYDEEHMPGLASVTGCVHAMRLLNHDHGPVSYACYDLVSPETLGCEAWLAVRHTDWSSRARPHFTNTKRTMFSLLP